MDNQDIARVFEEIAALLEIKGANPFKIRAYRNASEMVSTMGLKSFPAQTHYRH